MTDSAAPTAAGSTTQGDVPGRLCTWCKVPMATRLVAGGRFIHYTCPKCIFQHTTKRAEPAAQPAQ